MDTPEQRLAAHAASLRFADLPPAAVAKAKIFLLDTLSVGVAGSSVPEVAPLRRAVAGWGPGGGQWGGQGVEARIWGHRGARLPAGLAALVNGYQIHCQEWDSVHEGAVLHALATITPVLLAEAERRGGISGAALLTAMAAGVDVSARLGMAAAGGWRFFRPATAGGFGAVAALGNLRGMDAAAILRAFGHQLGQTSGTMQAHVEGSPVLPLQIGHNARAAIQSCDLAEAGLRSLDHPLTGPHGFLPVFEGEAALEPLLDGLGARFLIEEISHKPFPSGRATHGGVEAVLALQAAHGFTAEEVESVVVSAPPLIVTLVGRPVLAAPPANYARISMPFVLATALRRGAVRAEYFRGEALADPATHALSLKISARRNHVTGTNTLLPQGVEIRLRDGRVLTHEITAMLASPARPLDAAARAAKLAECWSLAAALLPPAEALEALVERVETLPDVNALVDACTAA